MNISWSWKTALLGAVLMLAVACSAEQEEQTVCGASETQACACSDGTPGEQTCSALGEWGACDCSVCHPGEVGPCQCIDPLPSERVCTAESTWPSCDCFPNRWVRIDDLSGINTGIDPGADLDAIILEKADGRVFYADKVEALQVSGLNDGDPKTVLGAPNTIVNPTEAQPVCDESELCFGLEGDGWVVVHMPAEIELGDHIAVVEVSGCASGLGGETPELFGVSINNEEDIHWNTLGTGVGPYARFEVVRRPR